MIQKIAYSRFSGPLCATLLFAGCGSEQEKVQPEIQKITESVYSSVTIQPDSLYQVYAAVSGILDRNLVEEGDSVHRGSPLLQIINSTPKLNADNAALNLQLAIEDYSGSNAVLKSLQDEIKAAELQYKNDSINYFRQKTLWGQKIGSEVEFENRKLAYELSGNQLQLLKNRYQRSRNELATRVAQAKNNLKTATINTGDFTVTSKINGTVYALYKNPGEIVSSLEPLAAVGSSDTFLVEMLVDEVDIVKLKVGQRALVTLDAYGNQVFEATLIKIYPRKDERSQTFKVEAIFKDPPEVLYPGLAGEGNIVVAEKDSVLTIPKAYLIDGHQVRTENGLLEVNPGLQNLERIEIRSGLDATTYIFKPEE